jgi:hypothetical protein
MNPMEAVDSAKIVGGGVVAAVTLPPPVSTDNWMLTTLHYALPLIYTIASHFILNLLIKNANSNNSQSNGENADKI